ncbi:MAG: hypothetical protein AAGI25_03230 [Bacteroidota bacterium]
MGQYIKNLFLLLSLIGPAAGIGQEYDDLYFTKSDREKQKRKQMVPYESQYGSEETSQAEVPETLEVTSFLGKQYNYESEPEDTLFNGHVSQKSIDYYKSGKTIESYTNPNYSIPDENIETRQPESNPNFGDPQDTYQNDQDDPVIINNYYYNNNGWNSWNNGWNSWNRPGWRNPRWNMGWGWNNWGGNFWNVSYGWGGWHDPFWDPFLGPTWGWNNWGWRGGFYRNAWCPPYGGFYNRPIYVVNDYRYRRNVVQGARSTRGGAVTSSGRSTRVDNAVVGEGSGARSYARQQRDYLNQSRSSRYSNTVTNTRSTRSRNLNDNSLSRRSSRNNSSLNRGNTSRNSNYGNTSRSRSSRSSGYRNSSRSRSSSYSRPSSSSGRSSGSVRSGSSSRSRSSGRSSSGRSSSGRSGSRRGN